MSGIDCLPLDMLEGLERPREVEGDAGGVSPPANETLPLRRESGRLGAATGFCS